MRVPCPAAKIIAAGLFIGKQNDTQLTESNRVYLLINAKVYFHYSKMHYKTKFLNIDLQLCADFDMHLLLSSFDNAGFTVFNCEQMDGKWFATIEPPGPFRTQESAFGDFLKHVESLDFDLKHCWNDCLLREFDIGVELPHDYTGASHPVSNNLLTGIASINGSLAFTAYVPTKIK